MPQHQADAALVEDQVDDGFGERARQSAIGYLPHLDHAVLRAGSDHIVVVWTPGNIQNRAFVAAHQRMVRGYAPNLKESMKCQLVLQDNVN